ncbi:hypothetical protein CA13_71110 [Planctomycetes bacterium CA13]|uniref:Uncharacterized protein n=1 Tax=Novipirellula herctigrandis TaxID=2527986 RepID=A0A5C5YNY0_9BACT|nr:hypothetical protein CA13_71110 [Planctomycetes bacterium CA13]
MSLCYYSSGNLLNILSASNRNYPHYGRLCESQPFAVLWLIYHVLVVVSGQDDRWSRFRESGGDFWRKVRAPQDRMVDNVDRPRG